MDTTDPDIEFDENGVCNYCKISQKKLKERNFYLDKEVKKKLLEEKINEIKEKSKNKQYNCVIGISGGVDSTFVAYKVKKLGLRPFAFHLDNKWNSKIVANNKTKYIISGVNIASESILPRTWSYGYVDWKYIKNVHKRFGEGEIK